jgi:hypothetical protein
MTDKTVLFVEGYEAENLGPITPGDAMFQPGERVTITSGDYEGEEGVVQAVGAGEGVYGGNIMADVLVDGTQYAERVPQEWLEA